MDPIIIGIIGLVILFGFMFFGLPLSTSLLLSGFIGFGLLVSSGAAFAKIAISPFVTASSYDLSCVALFILMAEVCAVTGVVSDLFDLVAKWLGRVRGGLAMTTCVACGVFGAISASGLATVTAMGVITMPEMRRYNYGPELLTGSIVCGSTIDILIPPSLLFIYYGILTETSILKLFIAGIVPGIILLFLYIAVITIWCRIDPKQGPPGPRSSIREKMVAFTKCGEILALIALVMGGLIFGWFTPTEAGAVGAFGAIVFSLIRKRLTWSKFKQASFEMLKTTGMIYAIMMGIEILSPFMAVTTIPSWLINWIAGMNISGFSVIVCLVALYLVLGTFMDEMTMIFLTMPIVFPVVAGLGFDPVWFGVLIVVMLITGTITPPMGLNQFIVYKIAKDIPLRTIYKGTLPFIAANIVLILLILFFPAIATFLPNIASR